MGVGVDGNTPARDEEELFLRLLKDLSCLSVLGAVERGCGRLELGVGLVCLPQDLLSFIAGQALLSGELEGLEA